MVHQREPGWQLLQDQFWEAILRFWSCWDNLQSALHSVPLEIEKMLIEHRVEVLTTKWFCDLDQALSPAAEWVEAVLKGRIWVAHYSKASAEHRAASIQRLIQRLASSPPEPCDIAVAIGEKLQELHQFAKSGRLEKFAAESSDDGNKAVPTIAEPKKVEDFSRWPVVTNTEVEKALHIGRATRERRQKLPIGDPKRIPFHSDDIRKGKTDRRVEPNWWQAVTDGNAERDK